MIFNNFDQLNQAFPKTGRLIALDVGTKRIGVAISDESRLIANPRLILTRASNQKDFAKIQQFFNENQAVAIVIGLPLTMSGEDQIMSEFVRKFSTNFDEFLEGRVPIFLFDERLSSFEARGVRASKQMSRNKPKFVDDIAASFILQHFLDGL
jgi:putative holliday junction resolvase